MKLPPEVPVILFGAMGGTRDPRKGWDLFAAALGRVTHSVPTAHCLVVGQEKPADPTTVTPTRWLGHVDDDALLAAAYSAADVTVVPSRQDNLPQSATEAHACGCPVVAFDCGGLPDVVQHGTTGYLARPYDVADLAARIEWVLADPDRQARLSGTARSTALQQWTPHVVVPQYLEISRQAIQDAVSLRAR